MAVTEVTRQAIVDELHLGEVCWAGRLEEPSFLSRLYRLDQLPSYDRRFADAAADIWQHRVNNFDWDDDWVFTDPRLELAHNDEKFLQFLAATVHPAVRSNPDEAQQLVEMYNRHLRSCKETGKRLNVTPDTVRADAAGAESIQKVLGSLGGIVADIADLRNFYGTGHGKPIGTSGLGLRHARLAVGAASTLAVISLRNLQ